MDNVMGASSLVKYSINNLPDPTIHNFHNFEPGVNLVKIGNCPLIKHMVFVIVQSVRGAVI